MELLDWIQCLVILIFHINVHHLLLFVFFLNITFMIHHLHGLGMKKVSRYS